MASRQAYSQHQQHAQNALIRKYAPKVYKALQNQIQYWVDLVQSKGIQFAQGHIPASFINDEIGGIIRSLYIDAAKLQKRWVLPVLKEEGKAFGLNWLDNVIEYFNRYIFEKVILPISRTTMDRIQYLLNKAVTEGWGVDKTVAAIGDEELTRRRAETIVRTESVRAMNASTSVLAQQVPYEATKEWIAIEDKRTRKAHTHAGVDGEVVDLDALFSNGLAYPGDPAGDAEQVINCRCTHAIRAKRDSEGNIIMKNAI